MAAISLSPVLANLPVSRDEYVFAPAELREEVERWIEAERDKIIDSALAAEAAEEDMASEEGESS